MSKFTMTTYTMPAASLGKDNPLPEDVYKRQALGRTDKTDEEGEEVKLL